jgi:hypothetical protein
MGIMRQMVEANEGIIMKIAINEDRISEAIENYNKKKDEYEIILRTTFTYARGDTIPELIASILDQGTDEKYSAAIKSIIDSWGRNCLRWELDEHPNCPDEFDHESYINDLQCIHLEKLTMDVLEHPWTLQDPNHEWWFNKSDEFEEEIMRRHEQLEMMVWIHGRN